MNRNAHVPVMMSPVGNMPRVVPGSTNSAFLAASSVAATAAAAAVLLPVIESWKSPLTNDASADERMVVRMEPFAMMPERVIMGVTIASWIVLCLRQYCKCWHLLGRTAYTLLSCGNTSQ